MVFNKEYRINYYLGELVKSKLPPPETWLVTIMNYKIVNDVPENNLRNLYLAPLIKVIKRMYGKATEKKFMLIVGDIEEKKLSLLQKSRVDAVTVVEKNMSTFQTLLQYCFVKNRLVKYPTDGVLLRCLNKKRHWGYIKERAVDSLHFHAKKNIAIWRGSTTGDARMVANRFLLVETWFKRNSNIDVGFMNIVQDPKTHGAFFQRNNIRQYMGEEMSPTQLLQYKYIISVRGNDKDSGLNWKLASRSVVFMARPTVNSWLMESELIPNVHYVLLKDDFSDLSEKVQWANQNVDLMRQISRNARKYMKQFENSALEKSIEMEVVKRYFDYMRTSMP